MNNIVEERYQFCIWLYRIAKRTNKKILAKPCHIKGLFGEFLKTPLYTRIIKLSPTYYNFYYNVNNIVHVYNIVNNNNNQELYIDNDYLNTNNQSMFDYNIKSIKNIQWSRFVVHTSNILIHDNKAYIGLIDYTELDNNPWYRPRNHEFGQGDPVIYVWNMETSEKIETLLGHQSDINYLTIYENKLYSASKDNFIFVWDIETYENTLSLRNVNPISPIDSSIKCLTIHNNILYSGSEDNFIYLWNIDTEESITILVGHLDEVNCLTIYENKLYSGGDDYAICIWNINTYKLLSILKGHSSSVNCLTIYENKLYSGSSDCAIRVWNIETKENIATVIGHFNEVHHLTIHNKKLYSVSNDDAICAWKI